MLKRPIPFFIILPLLGLWVSCFSPQQGESAWIKPIDPSLNLNSLRFNNSELLVFTPSKESLIPFTIPENLGRGDESLNFQETLFYNSSGFSDFLGEFTLTFYEVPFQNQMALSIKIDSYLWDASFKRSREFLPLASPSAQLIFVSDPKVQETKTEEDFRDEETSEREERPFFQEYPMLWDGGRDALSYEALLTPAEVSNLLGYFETYPEGELYLNISDRHYNVSSLKESLGKDLDLIQKNIATRSKPALSTLTNMSSSAGGRRKFSSPWMPLSSFFVKAQISFTTTPSTPSRVELILGSYNPTLLRNIFMGNASLVLSADNQILFLNFEKQSFFNSQQNKQTALLSFYTIPVAGREFFEEMNWKDSPQVFWQINMVSQNISQEELGILYSIIGDPTHSVSLSLTEDLLFSSGGSLDYTIHLLNLLSALKLPLGSSTT